MQNNLFRKELYFVLILVVILLIIHPAIGKEITYSNLNNNLPDYIITKVGKGYDVSADGTYYYVVIKNIGDSKGGWGYTIYIDEYKVNLFKPDEKYNDYVIGESGPYGLEPEQSRSMRFSWGFFEDHPWFPRYECILQCDFSEKNFNNNYFEKTYFNSMLRLIPLPNIF